MKVSKKTSIKVILIAVFIYFCLWLLLTYIVSKKNGFCDLDDYLSGYEVIKKECRLKLMKQYTNNNHGARYRINHFFINLKPNSEVLKEFDEEEIDFMCNKFNHAIDSDIYDKFCKQRDINNSKE